MKHVRSLSTMSLLVWNVMPNMVAQAGVHVPDDLRKVRAVQLRMKAEGDRERRTYYASQKAFDAGTPLKDAKAHAVWMMDVMDLSKIDRDSLINRMNAHLASKGLAHADSADRADDRTSAPLRMEIEDWQYSYIKDGAHRFNVSVRWTLLDMMDRTSVWDTLTSGSATSGLDGTSGHAHTFGSAMIEALNVMLDIPAFRDQLHPVEGPFSAKYRGWPVIDLLGPVKRTAKVREVMPAVVTIVQGKDFCSGVVVSSEGHILSGAQFVERDTATAIEVRFQDGSRSNATRMRVNRAADLALLKVERTGLQAMFVEPGSEPSLGDLVYAVSTPKSLDLGQSISQGILSGTRSFEGQRFFQTDVSISPGSSGGALTNEQGGMIGMLIAKWVGPSVHGLGFAVPAERIERELKVKLPR